MRREQFKVQQYDDFLGAGLTPLWVGHLGSASAPAPSVVIASSGTGLQTGSVRLASGNNAAGTMAVNGAQLDSQLNWLPTKGGMTLETRVALLSAITDVCCFVGFTNQIAALQMPFTLGVGDVLTAAATDAVGFLFDTAADTDNWWAVGVAASVLAAKQNLGVAPVLNAFQTLRVDISRTGVATFWRNGVPIGSAMASALTPGTTYTPVVAIFGRIASVRQVDTDYLLIEQNR